ncbi:MAG TPA: PAS domain S-box protein [Desulfatiglandales bacterium]|nr:PAS domain S-box protein [Desulfatiglandales bacterium]
MAKKPRHEELKQNFEDLESGDHLCFIYETEDEHRAFLTPFMRQGLERGEKVLYIADAHTREEVLNYLRDDGMAVEPCLKSGQLAVITADESYTRGGVFNPDAMIELLLDKIESSLEEGYQALRVTGEMTWALEGMRGSERIIEYEAKLNELFADRKCLAVCQYDKRRFKPAMLSDVLATHPIAVIGTEIFDNFYYVSPKDFFGPDREAEKFYKRLNSLLELKRAGKALYESEEKYRRLFIEAQDGIFIADAETGVLVDCNNEAIRLVGRDRSELIGQHQKILHPPSKDNKNYSDTFKMHLKESEGEILETQVITSTGEIKDVAIKANIVHVGNREFLQGIFHDITNRKLAEEALRESEKKYRTILESIEEGYYETDIQGNFTFFNDSMCKISGYTRDELVRMNYRDFLGPEPGKNVYKIFNKIYQTGQPARIIDYEFIKKDGSKISIEASASLIRDSGDKPVGFRGIIRDVTEGKKTEAELIRTKNFLQYIFDSSAECITTTDLHGNIIYISPRVKDILGYDHKELIGKKVHSLYGNGKEDAKVIMKTITEKAELRNHEMKLARKDGGLVDINLSASLLKNEKGETIGTLGIYSDVTEKKRLDVQLQQARKMEAIGTLAGGIAHDFNNILTSIIGNAELMLVNFDNDEYLREGIEEIKIAGERAASLTRQLLAFSRKQMIQPKILDLNTLLAGIKNMLVRIIGENIEILVIPESGLWQIKIDPGQMEQVIMNLAVNARDAMPNGGKLIIQTANMYLDENYFDKQSITFEEQTGPYVMVAVSDTGSGIDKKTQEHIFEPFYSTKEKGKGTGLGLSTVYGIAKQNKGFIWVYSEPGQGTTFKIYLPSAKEGVKTEEKAQTPVKDLGGSETVLVVEDNVSILNLAQKALQKYGYRVLTANSGEDALRICRGYEGPIDLLLTDVVMPTMGGKETVERLQPLYPHMKVIYMSGYTDDAIVHLGVLEPGLNFIEKPFSPEALAVKVREVLTK